MLFKKPYMNLIASQTKYVQIKAENLIVDQWNHAPRHLRNAIGWYITFAKKVDWANLNSDVYKLDLINCKM